MCYIKKEGNAQVHLVASTFLAKAVKSGELTLAALFLLFTF